MERFDDTMSEKYINTPVTEQDIESLETGDMVYISGTIYTARDAAHKRLYEAIQAHQEIPVELKDNIILDHPQREKDR